ncbi:MAG: extracellular solute-binding protein [Spirochaetaceae bacterium]
MKINKLLPLLIILIISCKEDLPIEKEVVQITAYLDTIIQDWEGPDEFIEEYNRLTNTELTIIQPPHQQYMDKLIISFTEPNTPDICEILPEYLSLFISHNNIINLDPFIKTSTYIKDFDPSFLDNYRNSKGEIYGFPTRDGGGCVTYIRKDWLDNLGLKVPTTWDEFYNVLYQFTHNDPDQNGLDDTKGYTDINSASQDWYNRAVMLDARVEIYYKDGEWVDGFTEVQMIGALKRLKRIYQENLTDSNITNNTTFTARNRFINGDVGVITYWANHWARNLEDRTKVISGNNAEIIPIQPLNGGYYIKRVAPLLVITKKSNNPGLVFSNFIDKQYDKADIQTLFTYGVKGFHWSDDEGEIKFLINEDDPYKVAFTKAFVPPVAILNDWEQPMKIDDIIVPALNILNNNSKQDRLKHGGTYYSQYYLEIETKLKPEIISKIINDELSIDEGIILYKKKSQDLFINKIIEELGSL